MKQWLGALLMVVLAGCSTMEISADRDPKADFTSLRTYGWIQEPRKPTGDPRIDDNTLLDKRVRTAVNRELAAKGFTQQTTGTPDFLVAYHVSLDKKRSVQVLNDYYGYGAGWGHRYGARYRPYGWAGSASTYTYEYEEGTLILDIVKPEGRQLMWRGSAKDEVHFSASPEKKEAKINEAVKKILARFPPN